MERAAAAFRGDDVEDVAEREVGQPESQLLVDVERGAEDGRPGEPDDEPRARGGRERQEEALACQSVWVAASACISGVSGAERYGDSLSTWVSW